MRYIDAIKGGFVAFIIFGIASIYVPGIGPSDDVKLILTISTFLFAIIAGFFISRFNSRYDKMRELVATEDAYFLSLYNMSKFYGESFSKKMSEIIDKYYLISYDFELGTYYKHNAKYLDLIYEELRRLFKKIYSGTNKNRPSDSPFTRMTMYMAILEDTRNKSSVLSYEKIRKGQWIILFILSSIIIFSIFYLKVPEIYSQVITVLLSTTLVLVLLILRDLQNLRLGGTNLIMESGEEVFEEIGKLRYYNKKDVDSGMANIPKHIKKYRLGLHKPGEKSNIKVVKNK